MKPKLILIGGGGHCASCIDVIEQVNRFEIAGIVDTAPSGKDILGYQFLGNDDDLSYLRSGCDFALITVGQIRSPQIRIRLFERAKSLGYVLPTIISPRAYVSKHASIGEGTIVMHDALINSRVTIGNNCIVNTKALIEHDAIVGDHCHISTAAVINGGVVVGAGSFVGSNAVTKESVVTEENAFIKSGSIFKGHAND
ncbi:MAG TPA: NeuD/PglB/VioB family sugar acetyltransferase [Nitrosomonas sp.]|nr:NeuD/PglB/VioB family sugar acetyltransferase [Nitrosomonas sp.]